MSHYRNHRGVLDTKEFKEALTEHLKNRKASWSKTAASPMMRVSIETISLIIYKLEVRFRYKIGAMQEHLDIAVSVEVHLHSCAPILVRHSHLSNQSLLPGLRCMVTHGSLLPTIHVLLNY